MVSWGLGQILVEVGQSTDVEYVSVLSDESSGQHPLGLLVSRTGRVVTDGS